jgi:hypothetical protein
MSCNNCATAWRNWSSGSKDRGPGGSPRRREKEKWPPMNADKRGYEVLVYRRSSAFIGG